MKIIRMPTVEGQEMVFDLEVEIEEVLVVNQTKGEIEVQMGEGKGVVPGGCARNFLINKDSRESARTAREIRVTPEESDEKGVEVQALRWRRIE